MSPNVYEFFSAFANDPKFFFHLPVLWTVSIDGVTQQSINNVLFDASEKWTAKTDPIKMSRSGNILVAQEVTLPQESSNFEAMEFGTGMGGYLPGYGLDKRTNFLDRSFTVNFIETKTDIVHDFFRPWLIAIGVKGLIEYGPSLKSSLEVRQYSNDGMFIRGFRFNKAFPTAVEGYTLNYENSDIPIKSVTFACQNYEQI